MFGLLAAKVTEMTDADNLRKRLAYNTRPGFPGHTVGKGQWEDRYPANMSEFQQVDVWQGLMKRLCLDPGMK